MNAQETKSISPQLEVKGRLWALNLVLLNLNLLGLQVSPDLKNRDVTKDQALCF